MRYLERSRQAGRELRKKLVVNADDVTAEELYNRLADYLWDQFRVEPSPAPKEKLEGGQAEVKPSYLLYSEHLDEKPSERLRVVAHEVGHLERHDRLHHLNGSADPTMVGTYTAQQEAPVVARYSRKSREEAEAEAFAVEFICPSPQAFKIWKRDASATSNTVAEHFGVEVSVARAQLAEALYRTVLNLPLEASNPEGTGSVDLDEDQESAAAHEEGPALIDAGPGTGKTTTLVERTADLIEKVGQDENVSASEAARKILVLTFSKEAIRELEVRIENRFGAEVADELIVATFHGFGRRLVHKHGESIGVASDATVLDEAGQEEIILDSLSEAECLPILTLHDPLETASEAARHISFLKQRLASPLGKGIPWTPEALRSFLTSEQETEAKFRAFCDLFETYEEKKEELDTLDFADLIAKVIQILKENPKVANAYQERFEYVLVDEYQDVSRAVSVLLEHLCGDEIDPWVVGDARQAIYRFLNAAPENVTRFEEQFESEEVFSLRKNYRSCPEIVEVANQMATLMSGSEHGGVEFDRPWVSTSEESAFTDPAVKVAAANSDAAEREGVALQVQDWIEEGADPQDIAILARRNIDVRRIVTELGQQGIQAVASGVLTPEGAAGDLAAAITFVDGPKASVPRITHALANERSEGAVDSAVEILLKWFDSNQGGDGGRDSARSLAEQEPSDWAEKVIEESISPEAGELVHEVLETYFALKNEYHSADAFSMMVAFLFDASDYLRRLLSAYRSKQDTERGGGDRSSGQVPGAVQTSLSQVVASLRLTEVVTAMGRAAGYRFTHTETNPEESRRSFGVYFRRKLRDATPTAVPPRQTEGAVQVMTCHASKGLEFPLVIAAGQTLSNYDDEYPWLPIDLQPPEEEKVEQANSLLFVSTTRAQRGLVISHAETASGRPRARSRDLPPLLKNWLETYEPPQIGWPEKVTERPVANYSALWGGGNEEAKVSARALSSKSCSIRTYIQNILGLRLPVDEPPIYPQFFDVVRFTMGQIVEQVHEMQSQMSENMALRQLERHWEARMEGGHTHNDLYYQVAMQYLRQFVEAFEPMAKSHCPLERTEEAIGEEPVSIRLNLISAFYDEGDRPTAMIFRPESYNDKLNSSRDGILWSKLRPKRRLPFVLLREQFPKLQPYVFSGDDGRIYPFNWSTREDSMEKATSSAREQLSSLVENQYKYRISHWSCDRCSSRLICPYWQKEERE